MKYGLMTLAFYFACVAAWVTALVQDGGAFRLGWLVVDIILSPVGVVRGFLMWVGAA